MGHIQIQIQFHIQIITRPMLNSVSIFLSLFLGLVVIITVWGTLDQAKASHMLSRRSTTEL